MIPVIMSGGSGTRLWPVSRTTVPKQFCQLFDESLQLKTTRRLQKIGDPWVLTVQSMKTLTEKTLKDAGEDSEQAIYEPFGRNTAPAIALACHVFEMKGLSEEVVGIFPADQLIQNEENFSRSIQLAEACAKEGRIVTLGIQPTYPATGFGYIEVSEKVYKESEGAQAVCAKGFREKPDIKTAEDFLVGGKHFWNAGMFVFQVKTMIEKLKKYTPDIWREINGLNESMDNLEEIYGRIHPISIDFAVMEKLEDLICVPSDLDWSDVGSWEEVAKLIPGSIEEVVNEGSENCFVQGSPGKVYGLVGVEDLIIVDTDDALLVSRHGKSQEVKKVVERLSERKFKQATEHNFEFRPWGKYEVLSDREDFKAKVITVQEGQRLSYQSHERRSEHWIVLSGSGEVTVDDQKRKVEAGDYVFIPKQAKHRMSAGTREPLVFFEVQTGEYFGEEDITRYQDDYQRSQ